ncbi:kinase [Lithospermum erythrorhizon]|uniref:Kinase n=1 Tax=Lithospermum erythrorhizon TaxID=34254 RepID=A0AAV3NI25_LITER
MYTLPLSGIESYLFQICYMLVHKPSPSLDKFVIDICSRSLNIALKVHWFLMAELDETDDNEGISRIQEKCQIAATLMGEWPTLIRPQSENVGNGKNLMLNKLLSSKQKLLSLTTSPPSQRSLSFSPSSGNALLQVEPAVAGTPEENKLFKKLIPSPRVREALLFRKSVDKDDEESEKDGFFKRLLRDSRDEDGRKLGDRKDEEQEKDGLFRKLLRSSSSKDDDSRRSVDKGDEESEKEGFFKRLLTMNRDEDSRRSVDKDDEESEKDGFFRRLLRDSKEGEEDISSSSDGFLKRLFRDNSRNESVDKQITTEDDGKEGFFRKIFKEKSEEKNDGNDSKDYKGKTSGPSEDDDKEGFLKKFFKDKFEDKKGHERTKDEGKVLVNGEEEEPSDFPLFSRLFRFNPGDPKVASANENNHDDNTLDSSPGTERFFRKLFRDRDRSVEDSELLSSKSNKEKGPGSPRQQKENSHAKPPLPNSSASQFRKGTYHSSLDFVESLCDTSYGLIDVFPIEDRKNALREVVPNAYYLSSTYCHLVSAY